MARHAILAAAAALIFATVGQPSIAEDGSGPTAIKKSVARAERVDQALGRHSALPLPDGSDATTSALIVPPFPPPWLYGQPFSQQPFFANRPIITITPAGGKP